jgi:hypothetical protein
MPVEWDLVGPPDLVSLCLARGRTNNQLTRPVSKRSKKIQGPDDTTTISKEYFTFVSGILNTPSRYTIWHF